MLKLPRFNYSQTYIPHGYKEFYIPPTKDGKFAIEGNYLHMWPRKTFRLTALPNPDHSYTVTFFMPFEDFPNLNTSEKVLAFFDKHFVDAVPLIGREKLVEDFFKTDPSPIVSIKCWPYHVNNKALILGDAAHAMVPFFGQGLNSGFEDCEILSELMDRYDCELSKVLPSFTQCRHADAEAINDLSMYSYVQMTNLVTSKKFLLRYLIDHIMSTLLPKYWSPLYTMVTFTRMRYSVAIAKKEQQDKILITLGIVLFIGVLFLIMLL